MRPQRMAPNERRGYFSQHIGRAAVARDRLILGGRVDGVITEVGPGKWGYGMESVAVRVGDVWCPSVKTFVSEALKRAREQA
mgnify:CR=1 FL=1